MSSLVGYGVSSDSESEEEPEIRSARPERENETQTGENKTRNFLLESGSTSGESSSESELDEEQEEPTPPNEHPPSKALPAPSFTSSSHKLPPPALGVCGVPGGSSVFNNPFKERAAERLNALQKHVPLTLHARPTHIGGKKVCVAYRKDGRCRFGIGCKFAHDSDLQGAAGPPVSQNTHAPVNGGAAHTPDCREPGTERDDEDENRNRKKKHKVGITDSLVPPKRALKQYAMQRDKVTHL
ncbi:uncharacterized protein si:ch211-113e8.11 [Trichomycterus rosablanca]|uniref:uncharacterized protein si:ch211-113e8.11 n=1 Tax=Trichomycterus rosablanca TaxID=2290929 RepID=UPI002F350F8B